MAKTQAPMTHVGNTGEMVYTTLPCFSLPETRAVRRRGRQRGPSGEGSGPWTGAESRSA